VFKNDLDHQREVFGEMMRELTESGLLVKSERLLKNKEKQAEIVVENQEMN